MPVLEDWRRKEFQEFANRWYQEDLARASNEVKMPGLHIIGFLTPEWTFRLQVVLFHKLLTRNEGHKLLMRHLNSIIETGEGGCFQSGYEGPVPEEKAQCPSWATDPT